MIEGSLWVPMRAFARRGIDKEERGRARLGGCVRRAPRQPNATIYYAASGPRNRRLDGRHDIEHRVRGQAWRPAHARMRASGELSTVCMRASGELRTSAHASERCVRFPLTARGHGDATRG
jgi:hypothetical protein